MLAWLCKIKSDLLMNLHLAQSFLRDFNRIFGSPDFSLVVVDVFQNSMERRRLPRSRGTNAENDAGDSPLTS